MTVGRGSGGKDEIDHSAPYGFFASDQSCHPPSQSVTAEGSVIKLKTIQRDTILISAMISIVASGIPREAGAQSRLPKSTKAVPTNVPIKQKTADGEKMVGIATIHVGDGSADKIRKTFKAAKIPVMVLGSKMYGVLVRQKDHDRALKLLKADSTKQHYWIKPGR